MKKALTALPLILALAFSFYWVQKKAPISSEVHEIIQSQFRQRIKKHIREENSSIKNLKIDKVWSEALSDRRVRVDFEYSFEESENEDKKQLKGFAVLKKELTDDEQIWTLNEFRILEQSVSLKETLRIKLSDSQNLDESSESQKNSP